MTASRWAGLLTAGLLGLSGCAAGGPPPAPIPMATIAPPAVAADPPAPVSSDDRDEARQKIHEMLARVSRARGLPVQREVPARVLDRGAMLARIRAHVAEEVPADAVENEGELLVAFELVPPSYDFIEGTYALIQGRIAGFYEPEDRKIGRAHV